MLKKVLILAGFLLIVVPLVIAVGARVLEPTALTDALPAVTTMGDGVYICTKVEK